MGGYTERNSGQWGCWGRGMHFILEARKPDSEVQVSSGRLRVGLPGPAVSDCGSPGPLCALPQPCADSQTPSRNPRQSALGRLDIRCKAQGRRVGLGPSLLLRWQWLPEPAPPFLYAPTPPATLRGKGRRTPSLPRSPARRLEQLGFLPPAPSVPEWDRTTPRAHKWALTYRLPG